MRARFAEVILDTDSREVQRSGQRVHLTPKAFDLLALLVESRPHVVSRAQAMDRLWPDTFVADSNLASLVKEIRRALGDDARAPRFVRTAHGRGYAFWAEIVANDETAGATARASGFRITWTGHEASLVEGENVLGRSASATVCVVDGSVSRRHAVIRVSGTEATIEDCDSKNGTFVGKHRVAAARPLADGDTIRVGKVRIRFRVDPFEPSTFTATDS
jgi:DNA-binding winged helix-turn-helix (wHTH) protein